MIKDREHEIEEERKETLKRAFGTEDISLGEDSFGEEEQAADSLSEEDDYSAHYSDDYDGYDSSENIEDIVHEVEWDLAKEFSKQHADGFQPKKRSHRHREERYTYPSEREYRPLKRRHRNQDSEDENSSDEHRHHHHHKSKHRHSKKEKRDKDHHHEHHSHKKDKHSHHHNQIDPDLIERQSNQIVVLDWEDVDNGWDASQYHTFNIHHPTMPSVPIPHVPTGPQRPEHPLYYDAQMYEEPLFGHGDEHMRYAAHRYGFELLNNLEEVESDNDTFNAANREGRKHRRYKTTKAEDRPVEVAEHIKEKTIQRQKETRPHWTAAHAHATTPIAPVDTHWRKEADAHHQFQNDEEPEALNLHPRDRRDFLSVHDDETVEYIPVIPVHHEPSELDIPVIPVRHLVESDEEESHAEYAEEEAFVEDLEHQLEVEAEKERLAHEHTRYHTRTEEQEPVVHEVEVEPVHAHKHRHHSHDRRLAAQKKEAQR